MSADRRDDRVPDLVDAFSELPEAPSGRGWQGAVWSKIAETERKRWPLAWKFAAALGPVVVAALLALWLQQSRQIEKRDRELALLAASIDDAQLEIQRQVEEVEARYRELLAAKTEEEKAEAMRALEEAQAELAKKQLAFKTLHGRSKRKGGGKNSGYKSDKTLKKNTCPPDDPLCGLGRTKKISKECDRGEECEDEGSGAARPRNRCAPDDPLCGL